MRAGGLRGRITTLLSSPLPLQGLLIGLLIGSNFMFAIGASDPWWRPKEWWVFCGGAIWLAIRGLQGRGKNPLGSERAFIPLMLWIVLQTALLHVLPVVQAPGRFHSIPWVWLTFLHLCVLWVWFHDICESFTEKDFRPIWRVAAGIGTVLSILMLLQSMGIDPIIHIIQGRYKGFQWLMDNHVIGLMGNPFQAGTALAILLPLMVALAWWIPAGLTVLALLATHSSSAIVAGFAGVLATLWLKGSRLKCGLLLALGLLGILMLPSSYLSFSGRIEVWRQSFNLWTHNFLWQGTGLGTYKMLGITAQSVSPELPNAVRWAHNEWLQIGMEIGLIGLILLLSALSYILLRARRTQALPAEASGILAAGLILSLSSIPFHLAPTAVLLVIALASVIVHLKEVKIS